MDRFVVCGETLIDLAPMPGARNSTFHSTWEALSAGGPMNSAVALAKLGAPVQFLGRLSTDRFGEQLAAHITGAGVGLDLATTVEDPTSIAVVSLDDEGKASYAFHFHNTANFGWMRDELPTLTKNDWLHFGSLLTIVEPGNTVVLEWLRECEAPMSMDINVRSSVIPDAHEYWETLRPWFEVVGDKHGIAKGSDDDINFLGKAVAPSRLPLDLARQWVNEFGLAMFVVTLGTEGAAVVLPEGTVEHVPGYSVEVVDTVGAGDTFMAGFLEAYVNDPDDLRLALHQGVAASAIVCARQGAQPPTKEEVLSYLGME